MERIRDGQTVTVASAAAGPIPVPGGSAVGALLAVLGSFRVSADSAGLIDQIRGLENAKSAIAALQAKASVAFDLAQRHEQAAAGVPVSEQGQGVAAQLALARRESPNRGSRLLGLAKALVTEMPRTMAALESGQLNEWRATLLVKETACLSAEDRCAVDEELAPDTGTFEGAGDRAIIAAAKAAAYRRDPRSITQRGARAATERHVSLRPAPDTMTILTALLPVGQGVAAYTALTRHADSARSGGDTRTRGQLMADTLIDRLTGTPGGITGVDVQLVMTDRTLFQGDAEPARLQGYGIVPAEWARTLLAKGKSGSDENAEAGPESTAGPESSAREEFKVLLRRLYTSPASGELLAMDSKARLFPPRLRRFIETRDDTCRTPYCDAPIRHIDHVITWHDGGPTSLENGAGLCEACNQTKENPGWSAKTISGSRHQLEVSTPTGHTYQSKAPPLPGHTRAPASTPPPSSRSSASSPLTGFSMEGHLLENVLLHRDHYN
ncbi:HNH endonuclease [Arthrobacter sp. StoSoilB5]|uniref:HNH endonuclease n=1 Tax=Arthrobacter sp. StoSoilB5 TaxID=2830992 RepID=UPI001CC450BD|nr:HNH endonuclease [Arthrobacter sp. StoSoilB5]